MMTVRLLGKISAFRPEFSLGFAAIQAATFSGRHWGSVAFISPVQSGI
jgi:hypothetical protein